MQFNFSGELLVFEKIEELNINALLSKILLNERLADFICVYKSKPIIADGNMRVEERTEKRPPIFVCFIAFKEY